MCKNKKLLSVFTLIGGLLLGNALTIASEIVDVAYVEEAAKRGAIIWDIRSSRDYQVGHIPGAVNIGSAGSVLRDPITEDFLPTQEVETILNAAGIDLGSEIIVYGDTGDPYAHWGVTTIRHFGGKNGKVYHGGLDDWKAGSRPLAVEETKLPLVSQKLSPAPGVLIYTPDVVAKIGDQNVQIVDVRSPNEYAGDDIRALRGGHLPGALNLPYEENWVDPESAKKLRARQAKTREGAALKAEDQLRALYSDLDPAKETIVYCQSGVRASETANVLRGLGFENVKIYEESWLGYGSALDAPAENVKFVNVGTLKRRISMLEIAVNSLAAQLEMVIKVMQSQSQEQGASQ